MNAFDWLISILNYDIDSYSCENQVVNRKSQRCEDTTNSTANTYTSANAIARVFMNLSYHWQIIDDGKRWNKWNAQSCGYKNKRNCQSIANGAQLNWKNFATKEKLKKSQNNNNKVQSECISEGAAASWCLCELIRIWRLQTPDGMGKCVNKSYEIEWNIILQKNFWCDNNTNTSSHTGSHTFDSNCTVKLESIGIVYKMNDVHCFRLTLWIYQPHKLNQIELKTKHWIMRSQAVLFDWKAIETPLHNFLFSSLEQCMALIIEWKIQTM